MGVRMCCKLCLGSGWSVRGEIDKVACPFAFPSGSSSIVGPVTDPPEMKSDFGNEEVEVVPERKEIAHCQPYVLIPPSYRIGVLSDRNRESRSCECMVANDSLNVLLKLTGGYRAGHLIELNCGMLSTDL